MNNRLLHKITTLDSQRISKSSQPGIINIRKNCPSNRHHKECDVFHKRPQERLQTAILPLKGSAYLFSLPFVPVAGLSAKEHGLKRLSGNGYALSTKCTHALSAAGMKYLIAMRNAPVSAADPRRSHIIFL
jgi:hypothetical protein